MAKRELSRNLPGGVPCRAVYPLGPHYRPASSRPGRRGKGMGGATRRHDDIGQNPLGQNALSLPIAVSPRWM